MFQEEVSGWHNSEVQLAASAIRPPADAASNPTDSRTRTRPQHLPLANAVTHEAQSASKRRSRGS